MSDLEPQPKYKIGDTVRIVVWAKLYESTIKAIALHRKWGFRYQLSGVRGWFPERSLSAYSRLKSSEVES